MRVLPSVCPSCVFGVGPKSRFKASSTQDGRVSQSCLSVVSLWLWLCRLSVMSYLSSGSPGPHLPLSNNTYIATPYLTACFWKFWRALMPEQSAAAGEIKKQKAANPISAIDDMLIDCFGVLSSFDRNPSLFLLKMSLLLFRFCLSFHLKNVLVLVR